MIDHPNLSNADWPLAANPVAEKAIPTAHGSGPANLDPLVEALAHAVIRNATRDRAISAA